MSDEQPITLDLPSSVLSFHYVPLSDIIVGDRERVDLGNIDELMESLITHGQMMPLLVRKSDMRLIDGGRRYEAMSRLQSTSAAVVFREHVSDVDLKIMEFEANERRKPMTWQEKVRGIRKIHLMRAKSAAITGDRWSYQFTGNLLGVALSSVSYAINIANALDSSPDHPCHKAGSTKEALDILIKLREDELTKALAKQTGIAAGALTRSIQPASPVLPQPTPLPNSPTPSSSSPSLDDLGLEDAPETASKIEVVGQDGAPAQTPPAPSAPSKLLIPLSEMFHHLPAEQFLPLLKDESVDHFITDPPYAIDMANLSQGNTGMDDIDRVEATHQIKDNLELLQFFLRESFRALRPGGWTILWYDLDHHEKLMRWASDAGYSVQRWPFHWIKTHPCLNQQASKNFTKATEVAMCLRKGNATLVSTQPTNFIAADGRIDRAKYKNPFAKPQAVWQALMRAVAIRGQIVCDPFGGEFSSALAAIELGLRPLCCEIADHHYNAGIEHVKTLYRSMVGGEVEFI